MSDVSKTDREPLGANFDRRLRAALNHVQPPASTPRYLSSRPRSIVSWRLAPVGLAIGLTGVLALTAFAATGSPNPVVWTERAVSTIESAGEGPEAPGPEASPTPEAPEAAPAAAGNHESETSPGPEPAESPEPSDRPEGAESPEPTSSGGESGSGGH